MTIVRFDHVTKEFRLQRQRSRSFQELFLNALHLRRAPPREQYEAIHDVSFSVGRGEMVGIIGQNGAGKSTILKLISRIIEPTSGDIEIGGRVGALLELGAGFHPELTGRENIYLNGSILGLGRSKMDGVFDDIVAFSEMAHFIDIPVKHYSSGMYMRLGFSIAIHIDPDVLLVDEVLSVGDQVFQHRCLDRINKMKREGIAIILVTHDLESVRVLCDRAILLTAGRIAAEGPPELVLSQYLEQVRQSEERTLLSAGHARPTEEIGQRDQGSERRRASRDRAHGTLVGSGLPGSEWSQTGQAERPTASAGQDAQHFSGIRWGSYEAEITHVQLLDSHGEERRAFQTGQPFVVRVHFGARQRIEKPQFGVALHHVNGFHINGPNTVFSGLEIEAIEGEGHIDYVVDALPLLEGSYLLSVSLYDHEGAHAFDHHHQAYAFRVHLDPFCREKYGTILIPSSWHPGPTGFEFGSATRSGDTS